MTWKAVDNVGDRQQSYCLLSPMQGPPITIKQKKKHPSNVGKVAEALWSVTDTPARWHCTWGLYEGARSTEVATEATSSPEKKLDQEHLQYSCDVLMPPQPFYPKVQGVFMRIICLPSLSSNFLRKPFADAESGEAASQCESTWASWSTTFSLFREGFFRFGCASLGKTQPKSGCKCAQSVTRAKLGSFFRGDPIVLIGNARFTKRYLLHGPTLRCLISKIGRLVTLIDHEPLNSIWTGTGSFATALLAILGVSTLF